jgi:hypothetical protein
MTTFPVAVIGINAVLSPEARPSSLISLMGKIVGPAQAVAANDKGRRRLKTYQGQVIELERDQAYRSHCEVTSFPSG